MTKMRNNVKMNTECALYEISKMGYMKTYLILPICKPSIPLQKDASIMDSCTGPRGTNFYAFPPL